MGYRNFIAPLFVVGTFGSGAIVQAQENVPFDNFRFYAGVHIGSVDGSGTVTFGPVSANGSERTTVYGGLAGIDFVLGQALVIGGEVDVSVGSRNITYNLSNHCGAGFCHTNRTTRVRAKAGVKIDKFTIFATTGVAVAAFALNPFCNILFIESNNL